MSYVLLPDFLRAPRARGPGVVSIAGRKNDLRRTYTQMHESEKPSRLLSLLEMLAATAIVAGTMAPALAVMRDAMAISREAVQRNLVCNYAVQILEGQAALAMQNWSNGTVTGNFASDGYSTIKYTATKSDAVASGGLVNRLMHIQVTAYEDKDADGVADSNEVKVTVRTKIAKMTNYTNAPN